MIDRNVRDDTSSSKEKSQNNDVCDLETCYLLFVTVISREGFKTIRVVRYYSFQISLTLRKEEEEALGALVLWILKKATTKLSKLSPEDVIISWNFGSLDRTSVPHNRCQSTNKSVIIPIKCCRDFSRFLNSDLVVNSRENVKMELN